MAGPPFAGALPAGRAYHSIVLQIRGIVCCVACCVVCCVAHSNAVNNIRLEELDVLGGAASARGERGASEAPGPRREGGARHPRARNGARGRACAGVHAREQTGAVGETPAHKKQGAGRRACNRPLRATQESDVGVRYSGEEDSESWAAKAQLCGQVDRAGRRLTLHTGSADARLERTKR